MKLYWIHNPEHTDPYTEGYIGVTAREIPYRLEEHKTRRIDLDLSRAVIEVLHTGTKKEISSLEEEYRPSSWIGWNKCKGGLHGGRPTGIHTSGWTQTEESNAKRSASLMGEKNPQYGRTTSDAQKTGVSKAMKGKKKDYQVVCNWPTLNGSDNPKARKVIVDGVVYDTVKAACDAFGFKSHNAVRYRCKSPNFPTWEFA